ncbi:MAG: ATP synthase F0 subunit B [Candidatus Adiutrix sp.]|jgi:F-type H+-transporting ATPase subunit b|nr:ATP synthase F0 subunit B [Candidatus Adiutrix sp.]
MKRFVPAAWLGLMLLFSAAPALAAGGNYSEAQIRDLLYRIMNFALFFAVLFCVLRKPLAKLFRDRREGIARNLEYLETQARNLEEQTEIMNKQIANIASERDSILAQYERLGQKEAERIIAEARRAAEGIIQKTQAAMDLEIKAARQALLAEIVRLSTETATDLVKNNINADDQKRLTGEFMRQVEKLKSAN